MPISVTNFIIERLGYCYMSMMKFFIIRHSGQWSTTLQIVTDEQCHDFCFYEHAPKLYNPSCCHPSNSQLPMRVEALQRLEGVHLYWIPSSMLLPLLSSGLLSTLHLSFAVIAKLCDYIYLSAWLEFIFVEKRTPCCSPSLL